jgi:hypothetical protein
MTESAPVLDLDHFPVTIPQSRTKAAADALWSVAFGAVSASAYNSSVAHSQGWSAVLIPLDVMAIAIFAVCAIGSVIAIVRPPRLVLNADGITQRFLLRAYTIPWREVRFDYLRPRTARLILPSIVRHSGAGATLRPGWAMQAERLAALLSAARSHWVGSPQSGSHA